MSKKLYPTDILIQAQAVLDAWKSIDPELKIGELTQPDMDMAIAKAKPIQSQLNEFEVKLTDLRNQRDMLYGGIWDRVKRVRNGIKGIYGDDSSQYQMIGGTRRSERKPPRRKKIA
jgi:hypothetical protein